MSKKHFRVLILCYAALVVASSLAPLIPGGYSQEVLDALDNEATPWILENPWATLAVGLPLAAVAVAGAYGLYMLKRWGRTLSLYSTAIGFLFWPFFGPILYSGIEGALVEASTLLWGAILALSYYSTLGAQFNAKNDMQVAETSAPEGQR